ncbi:hypothetical protein [Ornithinibacillus halotolerans]|uniref:Uncharacterized protein n=1 Tax=Ornithinibacillus halotolerans TaxID=1274357 RepID=A0A916RXY6_9BACI|nr:hypothetical protein [Ornithinibacillus halotolerans]GGA74685.1 hypothetical protein GCM10008025_18050 [Ornithinibacillus halotolerans]
MSEENKNRNRDTGRQKNYGIKYNTEPERNGKHDEEFASDSEFLNINGKKNKRKRDNG